jgi:hypothetical protein
MTSSIAGNAASTVSLDAGDPLQAPVDNSNLQKGHGESTTLPSLWDHAYEALKIKDPKLVEKYEKLLLRELQETGANLS